MRFLLALLFIILPILSHANCSASADSCEFYRCMEREQSCGKHGYWREFGYPYCQKFLTTQDRFSLTSQRWLTDVRECLQQRVGESVEHTSCSSTYRIAMDSHISCYVDTGFCELSFPEQLKIFWNLKGALRRPITWKEAHLLNKACATKENPQPLRDLFVGQ